MSYRGEFDKDTEAMKESERWTPFKTLCGDTEPGSRDVHIDWTGSGTCRVSVYEWDAKEDSHCLRALAKEFRHRRDNAALPRAIAYAEKVFKDRG